MKNAWIFCGWLALALAALAQRLNSGGLADVALVHLGTNDVFAVGDGEFAWDDSVANLASIIGSLRRDNSAVQIYLAQILPIIDTGSPNPGVAEWNRRVAAPAAAQTTVEPPIFVVDMNSGFGAGDFDGDGVHPNETGGQKMAELWARALL